MGDFDVGTAATIARELEGVRSGRGWRCTCPIHGGHSLTLTEGRTGALLATCWGGGCDFAEIMEALRERGVTAGFSDGLASVGMDESAELARRIRVAQALYRRGEAASETIVEAYLRGRGITLPVPSALRLVRWYPHRTGGAFPAMVAAVVDVNGEIVGCHATFLAPDGVGKYAFADKALQRECRGSIRGGAVRLGEVSRCVSGVNAPLLLVAEGIETALSCSQMFDLPAWAALSTTGLMALELPPEVESVVIAADNDANNAGHLAATAAYHRWTAEGRHVRLIMPPAPGTDFNDVLMGDCDG